MKDKVVRLDKFLANAGVLSRRAVKDLIKKQLVTVNDEQATEAGFRIDPDLHIVKIDGKRIIAQSFVYFLLNKPKGYISTVTDTHDRKTVVSLVPVPERIYPVGRLDKDTHGLMLLTNDGELTHKLIHPRYHVPKVYRLSIAGQPTPQQIRALQTGVLLEDGITKPAIVVREKTTGNQTVLRMTLHEGRNRQIRRMCETVGVKLLDLERIAFGPIPLGRLKLGTYRKLTENEVARLAQQTERS